MKQPVLVAILVAAVFTGCASRTEQQHAADAIEAQKAIIQIQAPLTASPDPVVAKAAVDTTTVATATIPRIENTVSTPQSELPLPTVAAPVIAQNVPKWVGVNPPPPAPAPDTAFWAAVSSTGLIALFALKRAAPLVPGLGPTVGAMAELAWSALAHKDQKAADDAKAKAAASAAILAPVLIGLQNSLALDPELRKLITPEVIAAAHAVAKKEA